MNIKINGTNVSVTDAMKDAIEDKLSFLEKFTDDKISVHVTNCANIKNISVVLIYNNKVVKLEEKGDDFYSTLDKLVDRLKNKISKLHSLKVKQNKDHDRALKYMPNPDSDIEASKIVKRKHAKLIEMSEAEAIDNLEANEYASYIFVNTDNDNKVSMVYLRNDGNYGILDL